MCSSSTCESQCRGCSPANGVSLCVEESGTSFARSCSAYFDKTLRRGKTRVRGGRRHHAIGSDVPTLPTKALTTPVRPRRCASVKRTRHSVQASELLAPSECSQQP